MKTKEEKRIDDNLRAKKYANKNRQRINNNAKEYYKNNKEKMLAQMKENQESKKLPYYIVYGLPNEMYCGITNQPEARMRTHKRDSNDTEGYFIISIHSTRKEALEAEKAEHKKGWLGAKK